MAEGHSPLHQFEVKTLIPMPSLGQYNIDFTNASLFMVLAVVTSFFFLFFGMARGRLVPTRWQSMVELTYEFVSGTVRETVGHGGKPYFPFVFSIFIFVLFANCLGMIPYSFTVTSHIIVTFALAALVFLMVIAIGLFKHGLHFFSLFAPKGIPVFLLPLIVVIELFSFLMRPFSLSIRLAANMMAGHILLKVIAGFVTSMAVYLAVIPLGLSVLITGFEIGIALLQAYIFTVLTCVYLHDAVHLH